CRWTRLCVVFRIARWVSGMMATASSPWASRYSFTAQQEESPSAPATPPGPYHVPPWSAHTACWGNSCTQILEDGMTQGGGGSAVVALMLVPISVKLTVRMAGLEGS